MSISMSSPHWKGKGRGNNPSSSMGSSSIFSELEIEQHTQSVFLDEQLKNVVKSKSKKTLPSSSDPNDPNRNHYWRVGNRIFQRKGPASRNHPILGEPSCTMPFIVDKNGEKRHLFGMSPATGQPRDIFFISNSTFSLNNDNDNSNSYCDNNNSNNSNNNNGNKNDDNPIAPLSESPTKKSMRPIYGFSNISLSSPSSFSPSSSGFNSPVSNYNYQGEFFNREQEKEGDGEEGVNENDNESSNHEEEAEGNDDDHDDDDEGDDEGDDEDEDEDEDDEDAADDDGDDEDDIGEGDDEESNKFVSLKEIDSDTSIHSIIKLLLSDEQIVNDMLNIKYPLSKENILSILNSENATKSSEVVTFHETESDTNDLQYNENNIDDHEHDLMNKYINNNDESINILNQLKTNSQVQYQTRIFLENRRAALQLKVENKYRDDMPLNDFLLYLESKYK